MESRIKLMLAVTIILVILSIILHMPIEVQEAVFKHVILGSPLYNDVYALVKYVFYSEPCNQASWFWIDRNDAFSLCRGGSALVIPFIDYRLNQPPLAGFILALITMFGLQYSAGPGVFLTISYMLHSILSAIAITYSVYRASTRFTARLYPLYALTIVVYGVYGFDTYALPFIIEALISIREGKLGKAGLFSALGMSINFFTMVLLGLLIYLVIRDNMEGKSVITGILFGLTPYFIIIFLAPDYPGYILNNMLQPAFNNGVFLLLTSKLSEGAAYAFNTGLWLFLMLTLYSMSPPLTTHDKEEVLRYIAILMFSLYSIHPQMVPQTLVITLLPLIATKMRGNTLLTLLIEAANALIIALWFEAATISSYLSSILGIVPSPQPTSLDNPVQWVVQFRNALAVVYSIDLLLTSPSPEG
ncbi:MAG: hypothetical protein ACP5N5_01340 [Desulfurococcus sp.]|uniref:hypothetical protein n=1 Tax=Desulfurococcus sp. TaxID=51678 RepID=UPI003D0F96E6